MLDGRASGSRLIFGILTRSLKKHRGIRRYLVTKERTKKELKSLAATLSESFHEMLTIPAFQPENRKKGQFEKNRWANMPVFRKTIMETYATTT